MSIVPGMLRMISRPFIFILAIMGAVAVSPTPAHGQGQGRILRVCEDTSCDWSSLSLFFTDLRAAIAFADPEDEIWVAAGTYIPTGCSGVHPVECSFDLPHGVELFGNFCGTESDLTEREPLDPNCVTILDGKFGSNENDRVLHVVRADIVAGIHYIDGFTIRRGWARGYTELSDCQPVTPGDANAGGGMLVTEGAITAIIMCRFEENQAGQSLCCEVNGFSVPLTFRGLGGAIALKGSSADENRSAIIQNSVFSENVAMAGEPISGDFGPTGGAIYKDAGFGHLTIMNSVFHDNIVDASEPKTCSGGTPSNYNWTATGAAFGQGNQACGVTASGGPTEIWNCTIYGNSLIHGTNADARGAGIFNGYMGSGEVGDKLLIRNSILRGNTPTTTSTWGNQVFDVTCATKVPADIQFSNILSLPLADPNNIDADPLFEDAAARDFSLTAGSPCIDKGTQEGIPLDIYDITKTGASPTLPVPDLLLHLRVIGCDVDMGAYEYPVAIHSPGPADLNGDCCVNLSDLLILLAAWGPCPTGPCPADLNNDDTVDLADLLVLLAAWGGFGCEGGGQEMPISTVSDCFERIGFSHIEALIACIEAMLSQE